MKRPASYFEESDYRLSCFSSRFCGTAANHRRSSLPPSESLPSEKQSAALITDEFQSLSVEERERVEEEIHGIVKPIDEQPEYVEESLARLDEEVNKIRKKAAYDRALFLSPNFVKDPSFRLMFLRADQFDAQAAGKRLVYHFAVKLSLFGPDKLVKTLTIDDLDDNDRAALASGSVFVLKERDQAGRGVLLMNYSNLCYRAYQNQLRMVWYQSMVAMEDLALQQRGLVCLFYNCDVKEAPKVDKNLFFKSTQLSKALPIRVVSRHYCYNEEKLKPLMSLLQMIIPTRIRFRAHYGTETECAYALMTFGISRRMLPINANGGIDFDCKAYFEERRKIEAQREASKKCSGVIEYPTNLDVLLGRGVPYQEYAGNLRLAMIIDLRRKEYQSEVDRSGKTSISKEIVQNIKTTGGRFLKRASDEDGENGAWVEVGDDVARAKVSHGFRTKTRRSTNCISEVSQVSSSVAQEQTEKFDNAVSDLELNGQDPIEARVSFKKTKCQPEASPWKY